MEATTTGRVRKRRVWSDVSASEADNGREKNGGKDVRNAQKDKETVAVKETEKEKEKERRLEAWKRRKRERSAGTSAAAGAEAPAAAATETETVHNGKREETEGNANASRGIVIQLQSEGRGEKSSTSGAERPPSTKPKMWSLDDDDDDEDEDEEDNGDIEMKGNGNGHTANDDDEPDPLDAFMAAEVAPVVAELEKGAANGVSDVMAGGSLRRAQRIGDDDEEEDYEDDETNAKEDTDEEWMKQALAGKLSKGDKITVTDHSQIEYEAFRKDFYIEAREIAAMSDADVKALRRELEGIKIRGKECPRPIRSWTQAGLHAHVLEIVTNKLGYTRPMPIQAQAIPAITKGRDVIGIAKTGSGKTMAFVLPMLRHINDQPPLCDGDGPIALIMAPTRELVQQISKDIRRFVRAMMMRVVSVFGGSGVANQIGELRRGAEVVVCTPGRMIDVLATTNCTNLRRVTFLVLDEADRMFDMGFEPQITRITQNVRPDRQTVMFSATFPQQVEVLARRALDNPVEIVVGGRSVVNKDITQIIEIRPDSERFLRTLELLGQWYEKGKVLIFVNSQDRCDKLFRDLLKAGYPCLSLHGGKDQNDRASTIKDFKEDVCNLLIATSVAARGLDVPELNLVINYDVPNHHEDYVHRVGRTGRAGRKGHAVTFIAPEEEEEFAPDLVRALRESDQVLPEDVVEMSEKYLKRKRIGLVRGHGSGFGGSGYKFNMAEDDAINEYKKSVRREHGEEGLDDNHDDASNAAIFVGDDEIREIGTSKKAQEQHPQESSAGRVAGVQVAAGSHVRHHQQQQAPGGGGLSIPPPPPPAFGTSAVQSHGVVPGTAAPAVVGGNRAFIEELARQQMQKHLNAQQLQKIAATTNRKAGKPPPQKYFTSELEFNDFPKQARWKVTHKDLLSRIYEFTGAAIVPKGVYVPPGRDVPPGERKLHLIFEGYDYDERNIFDSHAPWHIVMHLPSRLFVSLMIYSQSYALFAAVRLCLAVSVSTYR